MMALPLRRLSWLPPCVVGAAAFLAIVGPNALVPTNVGWLASSPDSLTHYLGWAFFRHAPWSMPVGMNPAYGLELASSILYSDSIPLLALLFKPLSPWLPYPFQYTGPWLLACFALQALFGWTLLGLAGVRTTLRLIGCALFLFAPPMLFRLDGHWSLAGHWIILAALVIALRPGRRRQLAYWTLLEAVAALVHMYLLAIATGIWLGSWTGDLLYRKRRIGMLAVEIGVVPVTVLAALWQAGFFAAATRKTTVGFGTFRFNLVAPINPDGWSLVLPNIAWKAGDYEGFAYLGLGFIAACLVALHAAFRRRTSGVLMLPRPWAPLGVVLLGFIVYAASNNVGVGLLDFPYPLPDSVAPVTGMMRASGRFVWPVFYALLLAVVALIARAYPPRVGTGLLIAAVAIQVVDTSPGWRSVCEPARRPPSAIRSPLTSGFWEDAPALYRRVRLVPPGSLRENWSVVADYASRYALATDAAYMARVDARREEALFVASMTSLAAGVFDEQTFYILQQGAPDVRCALDPQRDQLALVDGFWVLMPGWKSRFGERYAGSPRRTCPTLAPGDGPFEFTERSEALAVLSGGWSGAEPWGTWSVGPRSELSLHVQGPISAIEFTAAPFGRPGPPLQVIVSVDGQRVTTWQMEDAQTARTHRLVLPDSVAVGERRRVRITFEYSDIRSPASFGRSLDQRQIALGLRRAWAVQ